VTLRTALPKLERTFHLVHHERRYLSPTLERFIAHCLRKSSAAPRSSA
jgi:hypothetical protein